MYTVECVMCPVIHILCSHGKTAYSYICTMYMIYILSVTASSDYTALTQEQTFSNGTPRVCVSITLVGDGSNEDSETFSVSLSSTDSAVVLDRNVTTVTIGMSQLWSHAFM